MEAKDLNLRYNRAFKAYQSARQTWYDRGIENEEFVYSDREKTGTQFTKKQQDVTKEKKVIPITVNVLSAIKEQIQAFLTANKPSMTAIPVGRSSKNFAYVWKEICSAGWYLNKVSRSLDVAIGDALVVGNGYLRVRPSHFYSRNIFNTIIEYLPWQYVYLDPNSKYIGLEDNEMVILAVPVTVNKAKKVYELTDDEVEQCKSVIGDEVTVPISDTQIHDYEGGNDKCWIMEIYEKERKTIYILGDGRQVFTKPQTDSKEVTADGTIIDNSVINSYQDIFIRYTIKVGNLIKYSTILPITDYPIIKLGCKWNKAPYDYPVVHDIKDLQKALNTFLAITILNAQVASNAGYVGPAGSVDKAQWAKDTSEPGGFAEYEADPSLPEGGKPQPRVPQPLANAWYTLMMQVIKFFEYITGIYGVIQGNPEGAPQTLGATSSLQDLGTQRVKRQARYIDASLNDLFDRFIECVQAYGDKESIVTYVTDTDAMTTIETGMMMQMEGQEQQVEATQIRGMAEDQVRTILGSIKIGQYKVRFQNVSDLPSVRQQALMVVRDLLSHIADPEMAIIIAQQAMDLLDMTSTDEILNKVDIVNKMKGQIQQLVSQVEQVSEENKNLKKQVSKYAQDLELEKFNTGLADVRAKVDVAMDEKEKEEKAKQKETIY